jgi:predicted CXXCH cytochrome family protein
LRTHWLAACGIPGLLVLGALTASVGAQSVVGSKHDLSVSYGGNYGDPCFFCHTPHNAKLDYLPDYPSATYAAPLWNRKLGLVTFQPYSSSTSDTVCAATPSPYSLACLSCHDGVNAGNDKHDLVMGPGGSIPDRTSWPSCRSCHPEKYSGGKRVSWTGVDLRNDHPISMTYPTPAQDPAFRTPTDLLRGWGDGSTADIKLFDGKVECPSCHNVHNPSIRPFLRKSNANDALCLTCHIK